MNTTMNLIDTDDLDGPSNMALDEVFWQEAARGAAFLRFYGWSTRPTLSLGYFQRFDEFRQHAVWRTLPVVRRLTGGGAIVHDDELTYALALPASAAPSSIELYDRVHRAIQRALGELGITAELGTDSDSAGRTACDAMCFRRYDRFAVCVRGKKILGSAQRRGATSLLIHGSLLLGRSRVAPELPGLAELVGAPVYRELIRRSLARVIPAALGFDTTPAELSDNVLDQARRLAADKYANPAWTERRERGRRQPASRDRSSRAASCADPRDQPRRNTLIGMIDSSTRLR